MHQQVDVVDEEETEDDRASDGDDELHDVRVGQEDLDEASDDQDHQSCVQPRSTEHSS